MHEGVHYLVNTKLERRCRKLHRYLATIQAFPELAQVIVVIDDHHEPSMIVFQSQKLDRPPAIGWRHIERFHLIKGTEDLMRNRERNDVAARKNLLHLIDEIPQMLLAAKVVHKHEPAALEIFSKILDVLIIQVEVTGLT